MEATDATEADHRTRSDFVRDLVQRRRVGDRVTAATATRPPREIVQFWDDSNCLPTDVGDCMESWRPLTARGFKLILFDYDGARDFIAQRLGARHVGAYSNCYHPAMQSDYFRLCYLFVEGGCYVDADDVYSGRPIEHLFEDGLLKIQPLCYDTSTDEMIRPGVFTEPAANAPTWIFYFNNNPLIARRRDPLIGRTLMSATIALERVTPGKLPEIQSTTGPGRLTKSIFDHCKQRSDIADTLVVLRDWEEIATSKWPLSYRQDARNWRLSNQQPHRRLPGGDHDGNQK